MFANYRNALAATYRVVRELTGAPFFGAAVDAFALAHPSTGGDLNVYGSEFAAFLTTYPYARDLRYLPDVARLEWAMDEAQRAADATGSAEATLAALGAIPAGDVALQRFKLDPSCRLLRSQFPVMRIWQVHQAEFAGKPHVAFDGPPDLLMVRREDGAVVVERLPPGDFALARRAPGWRRSDARAGGGADSRRDLRSRHRVARIPRRWHVDGNRRPLTVIAAAAD